MEYANSNKITIFFCLAIAMSCLGLHVPLWMGMDPRGLFTPLIQIGFYSWGPALAVILMRKIWERGDLAIYGWSRKKLTFKWLFSASMLPMVVIVSVIGLSFILGNLFKIPGFGEVIMGNPESLSVVAAWFMPYLGHLADHIMVPSEVWMQIFVLLGLGLLLGNTLNLFVNLGEELGWRGFMLHETKHLGFLGSNFAIGGMQGLWSLPVVFYFLREINGETWWHVAAMFGYFVSASFLMGYMSLKSKSVYTPAIFTGVMNYIGAIPLLFIWGADPLLASSRGLVAMLVFLVITFMIIRLDPDFVENYAEQRFDETESPAPAATEAGTSLDDEPPADDA